MPSRALIARPPSRSNTLINFSHSFLKRSSLSCALNLIHCSTFLFFSGLVSCPFNPSIMSSKILVLFRPSFSLSSAPDGDLRKTVSRSTADHGKVLRNPHRTLRLLGDAVGVDVARGTHADWGLTEDTAMGREDGGLFSASAD